MSNFTQVISRPIKEDCNFNAIGNGVVYTLRREDREFQQINNDGGDAQIQINGDNFTAYYQVGDTVYIEGFGQAEITASAFSGGNTLITVDLPFTSSDDGYVNNLSKRTDYQVEVEVFDAETDQALGPRLVFTPSANGEVKADISGVVRAYLYPNWEPVVTDAVEEGTSLEVYIKYQEFYDVTYWEEIDDSANPVVCVLAVMHLLQNSPPNFTRYPHGGNMLAYCPGDSESQWLTRFVRPSIWYGWPFTISYLWPDEITSMTIISALYDSAGNVITTSSSGIPIAAGKVHRITLAGVSEETRTRIVQLTDNGSGEYSQELNLKVKLPCNNPVMLFWKNSKGGDSFWMFDESQDYTVKNNSGRKVKRLVLFADNLTIDEWDAINELTSPTDEIRNNIVDYGMDDSIDKTSYRNDNQVFIINQDGSKVGVMVIANDTDTRTLNTKSSIEITIELPELFTV